MTTDVEIQCITKTDRMNPHERIQNVGGVHDGKPWNLTLDRAIAGALNQTWRFWTKGGGKSVWVIVAYHNGNPYLKTENDGVQPDNLLSLNACPI